jgi:hypothetical protein
MEDLFHCLRECPYSKELWLRLGMSLHSNFFLQTDVIVWIHDDMACGATSTLFIAGLWQVWCWRNNMIFEHQHWKIHEVVRKTFLLHDNCITYYPHNGNNISSSRLLAHWTSPPEGTFKLNVDGSFLEDSLCHYEVGGDALLAELRAIQIGIDICHNRGYTNVICESDCLEAVKIFIGSGSHNLHVHASTILHISDALQQEENYTLVHILREQNVCRFHG